MDYSVKFIMGLVVSTALLLMIGLMIQNHTNGATGFLDSMISFG